MKLNEKILYYRKAAKLSQEELAAQVGVSRQAVSKWELGDATPEVDKLLALARAFGVTTDELLSESELPRPQEPEEPYRGTLPPQPPSAPPAEDIFDKATGLIGRLVRRYGWLAGVYIAVGGLPFTIIGALLRWGWGAMFAASGNVMNSFDFGGFGDMGVQFSPDTPPEMQQAILEQFGQMGQSAGFSVSAAPPSGIQNFFLGFATVIIVMGVVMMIAGTVLAVVLYRKGNKKP